MAPLRFVALVALAGGCYREPAAQPTYPEPQWSDDGYATGAAAATVYGPPGGSMDPGYGYGDRDGAVEDSVESSGEAPLPAPSADPDDPGYVMATPSDAEIDATLQPYGSWVEDEEYGRVWRPDATVVGAEFTPYETCGSWVYTDYGWTYACDWDWGWLPFHYGNWAWMDSYWGWVPGYTWAPAHVDWRYGGGYVGWRPSAPRVRDHRDGVGGPRVRDHRNGVADGNPRVRDHRNGRKDRATEWRFAAQSDLGKPRIRSHLMKNVAEGIRVTADVRHPPLKSSGVRASAASLMQPRLAQRFGARPRGQVAWGSRPVRDHRTHVGQPVRNPAAPRAMQPRQPRQALGQQAWNQPPRGQFQPPRGQLQPPRGQLQPPRGQFQPRGDMQPRQPMQPRGPSAQPQAPRPMYTAPRPSYGGGPRVQPQAPRPSYRAPRPSYSAPRTQSAPRPSYSAPRASGSSSSPRASSPRSSSGGGSRSFGGGSRSGGGGGGRRR